MLPLCLLVANGTSMRQGQQGRRGSSCCWLMNTEEERGFGGGLGSVDSVHGEERRRGKINKDFMALVNIFLFFWWKDNWLLGF